MKKNYEKPIVEMIDFEFADVLMNEDTGIGGANPSIGDEGIEDW